MLALLLGGYLLGVLWLWRKGRRPIARGESSISTPTARQASGWSAGKLLAGTVLALVAHVTTFLGLDAAARKRIAALRVEASVKAMAAAPQKPGDDENAAFIYEQAFALLPENISDWPKKSDGEWANDDYVVQHPEVLCDPALLEFLESQKPLIDLLHQAAAMPACAFEHDYAKIGPGWLSPDVTSKRDAMQLLLLQARVYVADGDLAAANKKIQTVHRMAEHLANDAGLTSVLISFALDNAAIFTLQGFLSGQNPTSEELAPLVSSTKEASIHRLHRAYLMEEANGLATIGQAATEPWAFSVDEVNRDKATLAAASLLLSPYRILLLDDDVSSYRKLLNNYQQLALLSPPQARDKLRKVRPNSNDSYGGPLTSMLVPSIEGGFNAAAWHAANMATTQAGVAVHRYRAENGKLPITLADLVPKYLPEVPLDPYDDQPLRWKVTGDEWIVYSIGEDLKDDGGTPINYTHPNRIGDIGFYAVKPPEPVEEEMEDEEEAEMEVESVEDAVSETPPDNEQ